MPYQEIIRSKEPRGTPQALIDHYKKMAVPLSADMLRSLVEPLAGSSFAERIVSDIKETFSKSPDNKPAITGNGIYSSLFHKADGHESQNELIGIDKDIVETAMWSHLSHNVALEAIYPERWLTPGELAFSQTRYDTVWQDPEHTQEAFKHLLGEWRLYKNGRQLGSIPLQSLYFKDENDNFHYHAFIPEGSPSLEIFHDYRRPSISSIPKELQTYTHHTRMVFLSEQFDYELAVRK